MIPTTKPKIYPQEYNVLISVLLSNGLITFNARRFDKGSKYKITPKGGKYYETILSVENIEKLYGGPKIKNPEQHEIDDLNIPFIEYIWEKGKVKPVITEKTLRLVIVLIDIMKEKNIFDSEQINPIILIKYYLLMIILYLFDLIRGNKK